MNLPPPPNRPTPDPSKPAPPTPTFGLNLRAGDNLFQGIFIALSVVIGVLVALLGFDTSAVSAQIRFVFGVLGGLIVGVIVSGILLMIQNALRRARQQK